MPRDLKVEAGDRPDWAGLRRDWGKTALLHSDTNMVSLALRAAGMVAYLATPVTDFCGGPVFAADLADEWRRSLIGLARMRCYSPAADAQIIAYFAGVEPSARKPKISTEFQSPPEFQISTEFRLVDLVVVPPMMGWDTSIEVWRVVRAALASNLPVYLLAEQAGAV